MNEDKIEVSKAYLNKAKDKYLAAIELYNTKHYDDSASRTYHSISHCLSALLFSKDMIFNSHKEVIGNFNKEFIKSEILDNNTYKIIKFNYENHETGDYEIKKYIDEKTASICLNNSHVILDKTVKYLSGIYKIKLDEVMTDIGK